MNHSIYSLLDCANITLRRMMMDMPSIGCVSEGTLKSEDLLDRFATELARYLRDGENIDYPAYQDYLFYCNDEDWLEEHGSQLVIDLMEELNKLAQSREWNVEFRNCEGDGAYYSWFTLEDAEPAITVCEYEGMRFTDNDVVELGDWIPEGESNYHKVRPWLIYEHGTVVCVVFASCEQDALDSAADNDKLDRFLVHNVDPNLEDTYACLGNASEFFNIDTLECIELPNCRLSFCDLFAMQHNSI